MKKKLKVFSLAPPRLGGLDMLLPIFMEMKLYGNVYIELVIDDNSLIDQLSKDPFLSKQVTDIIDKVTLLPKKEIRSSTNKLAKISSILMLLINILGLLKRLSFSKNPVLMHSGSVKTMMTGFLAKITKRKGGVTIGHFKVMDRLAVNDKYVTKKNLLEFGDFFICFNKQDVKSWSLESQNQTIEIGYPRLYKSWLETLKISSKKYLEDDLNITLDGKAESLVSIFLPSTVKGIFEERELKEWIQEVIFCLDSVFPDALIVLKPHPMQNITIVEEALAEINNKSSNITYLHSGLLASQSILIVSHHSSTIIDALALNKPVVQHHKFTEHWLKRHPEGSSLLGLGQSWTQDKIELKSELNKIQKNLWIKPNFKHNIGHRDNLETFFKEISLVPYNKN